MTNTWWETVEEKGSVVRDKLKRLLEEGNIRRVRVHHNGHVVAEFPLTVGVVGAVFAPVLAAVGAITALLTDCSIEVEREGRAEGEPSSPEEQS
ncbi:MAG: DUF4342 domain-containing protein [Vicinamibacterales bacterium]|nr:DUF4342 domain-containing protein [Vicinamibacterales bacterium]MDP7480794.1 DUF4342 domain-containing protein [Vicinamibacterales bacterium]MDP7693105.1 DUF4342 domain-containing protein [Vicinamibacterales bacterium]HJN43018.1 DUF4342 domain-containing protein [Vicinamibacterales bacterium]